MTSPDRSVEAKLKLDISDYVRDAALAAKATDALAAAARRMGRGSTAEFNTLRAATAQTSGEVNDLRAAAARTSGGLDNLRTAAARAGRDVDQTADAAGHLGDELEDAGGDAGHLQRRIEETTGALRRLGREFDKTGNVELLRDIRKERQTLSGLVKLRGEMDGLVKSTSRLGVGTQGIMASFSIRGIIGALGPVLGTAGTAIGVGLATTILAGLGGALGGAAISGVIAGGIASAARDSRVRAAWSLLAMDAQDVFTDFGGPFVQPTIKAINEIRAALADVDDDIQGMSRAASQFVDPLARGLGGFVREVLPGLRELANEAQPIFDMLGEELPVLGRSIAIFFGDLGDAAEGGAEALRFFINFVEVVVIGLGKLIEGSARAYEVLNALVKIINNPGAGLLEVLADEHTTTMIKAKGDSVGGLTDAVRKSEEAARDALPVWEDLFDQWMSLDEAAIRVEETIDELSQSLRENGRSLDINSEKGRNNRQAFLNAVEAAEQHRRKMIENGSSVAYANGVYQTTINRLYAAATAAGVDRAELDKLLRKYQDINRQPNITKKITFRQVFTQEGRAYRAPGGPVFFRQGGIHYAQAGLLNLSRRAQMFPDGRTLYGFAEAGTGGEAFIARNAPRGRSLAIGAEAMRWHGASVVPWEQMRAMFGVRWRTVGAGGGPMVLEIRSGGSRFDDTLVEILRNAIRIRGGNVQIALMGRD